MKIAVIGTRGFPGVQGGVEAHCENLYPRLARLECDISVFTRRPYVDEKITSYKNVNLISIDCPKTKSLETIAHTFKGIFAAKKLKPDILHIHAIGPSLLAPLARMLGMKVVVTNHGPDYLRKKWGMTGKLVLKIGEISGSIFANEIICVSPCIADEIRRKYKREVNFIPNGIDIPEALQTDGALRMYSLEKNKYILTVGRFVPEKGFGDLIEAFGKTSLKDWKLVIVGRADHEDRYSLELKRSAASTPNVILTGFLKDIPLRELYSHAGLFVLPSYYEGLPIVLLEAMSYGLSCIASDIPANRCLRLEAGRYFPAAGIDRLSEKIKEFASRPISPDQKSEQIEKLRREYDWNDIAKQTLDVYKKCV